MPEPLEFVKEINKNVSVMDRVKPRLVAAYTHLEIPLVRAVQLTDRTIEIARSEGSMDEIEQEAYSMLNGAEAFRYFDQKMDVRALMWYQKIAPYIIGKKFLDLGGGDGRTAKRV